MMIARYRRTAGTAELSSSRGSVTVLMGASFDLEILTIRDALKGTFGKVYEVFTIDLDILFEVRM